jgi:16S rRNA (uracil1498-N3)-methyltransferase
MARFFLPKEHIQDKHGTMFGEEFDHLHKVLRLGPGDPITIFDGTGWEHEAVIRSLGANHAVLEILRSYETQRESSLRATLALGLTKGEKMDWVVEKTTELGVRAIVPFVSLYTVPKLEDQRLAKRIMRWRKIAVSAAKQCGRTRIPEILPLTDFRALVREPRPAGLKLLLWEAESGQTLNQVRATQPHVQSVLLVVGAEGGFSVEEANLARENGFYSVGLGRRTLRAETAALTAVALAQFVWGDLA